MPYATTSFVLRADKSLTRFISPCDAIRADAVASTTSHPAFVTTRDRPSCRNGMAGDRPLIWGFGEAEFCPSCQFVARRRASGGLLHRYPNGILSVGGIISKCITERGYNVTIVNS